MQVITTHLNADFDCLASMVAAQKLYPRAKLVFSGSAERPVHEYLKEPHHAFKISRLKDIDLDKVTLLVIVDTQDPGRIGVFKSLLKKPGVEVHVYDHHPDTPGRVRADKAVLRKRGSSTTILCEILSEKNIPLSREESTLMALGIYEDTRSLISNSTTPEDFAAVGSLVRMGADLNVVADRVRPRMNEEQINVLNDLIRNLESHNINGVDLALATATADGYVEDLAYVVQNIMDLENFAALFVVVRLDKRVHLIARSRTEEVNVAEVARVFGGGGHFNAASAGIRDMTLVQVREKLLHVLNEKVWPLQRVKDIMHFPVVSAQKKETIQSVEKTLTQFNLNTLPVLAGKVPVGLITRQIVEKAIHHKMGKERTEDFMVREFSVTTPDSFFKTIAPVIIEEKQKLVPVVDAKKDELVGIVSRGDLLRVLYRDMARSGEGKAPLFEGKSGALKNVKSLMKERLETKIVALLGSIAQLAERTGYTVYVVGGFVRDLLLGMKNLDVDIVVEGDGIRFAKSLGKELKARVKSHPKFGTSVIILPDGFRVDVATARMEFYKHPAALPTVEKSSIKTDLFRRDFTFNSLAVKLNGKDAYCLIDFFNGERDLKDKEVRVLHNLSFIEDPCRLFRAIRFEQRFGFTLGKQTEAFMKSAIRKKLVDQLSGKRFFTELKLILREEKPLKCIRRMREFSLFQFISPKMLADSESMKTLERIKDILSWSKMVPFDLEPEPWRVYLLGLFYSLGNAAFDKAVERIQFPMRLRKKLEADREHCREALRRLKNRGKMEPTDVFETFSGLSPEAVVYLLALSASNRTNEYATRYLTQYRSLADLSLSGDDLIKLGIKPGPIFQTVFKTLREARVNGRVKSRKEEVALVEKQFLNS